ncbi:MAG: SDR family NAD(P)-dependent oxidoreductase, partial [Bacteroidales bacterium]|nr:SDR family NAD(P)-dependent oxidoreductase [Bacteroidales bacterium]
MKDIFKDKVVIVTGASTGIGRAIAKEFAMEGSRVMLAARSADKLRELEDEMGAMGCDVSHCITDVSCEEDCRSLIEATVEKYGTV